ncbi:MAG: PulJ/GspJ family protein [Dissulfurimicrobium sp.]|uniref:PulJ/GspJ family protein n=1 Tax=Dissulfurimicrobium TaxID=1769732 RepID=UPI001EDAD3EF|nr:prepilin-type N-terminal cleavage/methylation domain-containing protein [Dissulfurimicrobium hydrothermale]UKL13996.1 prepilin-type N-terminal cleavage/methylation domain-containing protein [Dissulfurimicrobium hydrothermale]
MTSRCSGNGFTLLELLISITLMAVITVILSMAIHAGLMAWERGHEEDRALMIESSIENLLARQLKCAIRTSSQDLGEFAMFKGDNAELSFVTTYVPLGSRMGGIFHVIYRYDADSDELIYAQRLITRKDELNESPPEQFNEDSITKGWVYSEVSGTGPISFFYCADQDEAANPKDWRDKWDEASDVPQIVVLAWGTAKDKGLSYRMLCTDPFCEGDKKR